VRLVAAALLAANILVAGYFFLADRNARREPDRLRDQVNADRIRVVAAGRDALALERPKATEDAARLATLSCATWGGLQDTQATAIEGRLASLDLGARLSRSEVNTASSYLVLIPPIPRRPELNRRVDELIRAGITDQFVINDGELRYGISLGFFKSEDAANRHLAFLKGKGVSDAVVQPRGSGNRTVTLAIKDLSPAERAGIEAIARDMPGTDLRIQPCPGADIRG